MEAKINFARITGTLLLLLWLLLVVLWRCGRFSLLTPWTSNELGIVYRGSSVSVVMVPANSQGVLLIALPGLTRVIRQVGGPREPEDVPGCWMNLSGNPSP